MLIGATSSAAPLRLQREALRDEEDNFLSNYVTVQSVFLAF